MMKRVDEDSIPLVDLPPYVAPLAVRSCSFQPQTCEDWNCLRKWLIQNPSRPFVTIKSTVTLRNVVVIPFPLDGRLVGCPQDGMRERRTEGEDPRKCWKRHVRRQPRLGVVQYFRARVVPTIRHPGRSPSCCGRGATAMTARSNS